MRGVTAAIVLCGGLVAVTMAAKAEPPPGRPDLALCPKLPREEPLNDRTKPLPVPRNYQMLITSSREQFAVATIYGGTTCVDTRAMTEVRTFTLSRDRRFLEFDWDGYEAGGHIVVDRTGKGQSIDTGVSPTSSPSGRLFAAIQQSEAAFGSLEGFGVWQVGVVGVRQLTLQEDIPRMADWRIDGWAGDACINLSGIPYERITDPGAKLSKFPRDRYVARPVGRGWVLTPSTTGCPAVKPDK
jgi:hypothetical protein